MRALQHTGKMLFLLIAIAVCALSSPKPLVHPDSPVGEEWVTFGQSLALSDFDQDGRPDSFYAGRPASGTEALTAPVESTQETADAGGSNQESDQIVTAVCSAPRGLAVLVSHQSPASLISGAGRYPSERSPPPIFI